MLLSPLISKHVRPLSIFCLTKTCYKHISINIRKLFILDPCLGRVHNKKINKKILNAVALSEQIHYI